MAYGAYDYEHIKISELAKQPTRCWAICIKTQLFRIFDFLFDIIWLRFHIFGYFLAAHYETYANISLRSLWTLADAIIYLPFALFKSKF